MINNIELEVLISSLFSKNTTLMEGSRAVYRGGSRVDPVIETPHDYDYICFAKPYKKSILLTTLRQLGFCRNKSQNTITFRNKLEHDTKKLENYLDISQIRQVPYTQITWFSYLDILMEKIIGEDCCPKTDIIVEHRQEFYECLYKKMNELQSEKIKNQKRWYHLLRGIYILINNSYEVTETQKKEINILHQLADGWEEIREKTIDLIINFKH